MSMIWCGVSINNDNNKNATHNTESIQKSPPTLKNSLNTVTWWSWIRTKDGLINSHCTVLYSVFFVFEVVIGRNVLYSKEYNVYSHQRWTNQQNNRLTNESYRSHQTTKHFYFYFWYFYQQNVPDMMARRVTVWLRRWFHSNWSKPSSETRLLAPAPRFYKCGQWVLW